MGKKNIKPSINQPVIRTHVAKPALEGLTEESLTSTHHNIAAKGVSPQGCIPLQCSYDGDDAE
ncbi:MAG: microcyclamide/patellamide family RiPP [Okeania sp. SIO2C2]|uniref:microcyclamide/patellamide family RiPP n=1 Tax=Okeania sp. SIO2C2 TaxID=2607787 RepID=UPI0013B65E80|nr:microcyclamide/patellamide family RiPP [Okeania sp. SIO2C2]NEP91000.1 microcyclamide/patellamide family RiPP [Okeania sp. SIO2C2]